jgi:ligand-binding sensor domain-containing protein
MPSGKCSKQIGSHPVEWILALLFLLTQVHAEQLPIRTYTSADGLAQDRVKRIVLDSRGFLWFCTSAGLSRFDGSRFVTYDSNQGLSYPTLNDLLQTRAGAYWVASNGGGVFLFNPTAGKSGNGDSSLGTRALLFANYPVGETAQTNRVNRLFEDRGGRIWAGTDDGLFVLNSSSTFFERVAIPELDGRQIWAFDEDREDNLWIGASTALVVKAQNGQIRSFNFKPDSATNVLDVLVDRNGRVWVANTTGLVILKPDTAASPSYHLLRRSLNEIKQLDIVLPGGPGDAYSYSQQDGLLSNFISSVFEASDGRIWIGGPGGINVFDGSRFHSYTGAQGLPSGFASITEDREHNLWFGSLTGGALKLAHKGLLTYRTQDGLANPQITLQ